MLGMLGLAAPGAGAVAGGAVAGGAVVLGLTSLGCAESRQQPPGEGQDPVVPPSDAQPPPPTPAPETAPAPSGPAKTPLAARSATGSSLQLSRWQNREVALVVDTDARAVRVTDAETLDELGHVSLDGQPTQLVVARDGRAYVALRDRSRVVALEASPQKPLEVVSSFEVATEPVALATDPAGERLVVTSAWGARLAVYDVRTHARALDVALPREPRGVSVSPDGATAHVAHMVGSRISKVNLSDGSTTELTLAGTDFTHRPRPIGCFMPLRHRPGKPVEPLGGMLRDGLGDHIIHERDAVQGFAIARLDDRVFVPQVLVHRGEVSVGGYGTSESFPSHQPTLAAIDPEDVVTLRVANQGFAAAGSRYGFAGGSRRDGCLLPRAAATDPVSRTVLVGCHGTNEVVAISADGTGGLTAGTRRRWSVPDGPSGIAVDPDKRRALLWSQFARTLAVLTLPPAPRPPRAKAGATEPPPDAFTLPPKQAPERTVKLRDLPDAPSGLTASVAKGRLLFHAAGDPRISLDGRACASCHPDGREDGLTWPTPFGARQTPMLAGRLGDATAPFGWQGDADTVHAHLRQTLTRLGGTGLDDASLDALVDYCHAMATPPTLADAPDAVEATAGLSWEQVHRGKELFFSEAVGCATCHKNGDGSDGSRHDVGSGALLDTPSLAFVAGTAPYFHDGRYATLAALLEHTQGTMGWSGKLPAEDLQALEAYLKTL